jgi:hypothetical protein
MDLQSTEDPSVYEYRVVRQDTHNDLQQALNELAAESWEPVQYALWSTEVSAYHFVILRRPR